MNRITFIGLLAAILAVVGMTMWYFDSPVPVAGAQFAASEGLVLAGVGGVVALLVLLRTWWKSPKRTREG